MKKTLLIFCLLFFTVKLFGQQFSQYNTGTVYDSFDNPAQRSFIPDSSKQFAFNFLIPNFSLDFYLTGNAQSTLKTRAFVGNYANTALKIGQGSYNHLSTNATVNWAMFKAFTSLNGDVEMGFSASTKAEGKGLISDESIALFNGPQIFKNDNYTDIFNDNYYYQLYNQFSFSYREKITKQFAFGIKVSALLGVRYEKLNIRQSDVTFDRVADKATLSLNGVHFGSYIPGHFEARDFLPTFRNPGASISLGSSYRTEDGFILQANIKDLGFIHWSNRSRIYNFNQTVTVDAISAKAREDNIYNNVYKIIHSGSSVGSFTTTTNGRAELSVNKSFWIDADRMFKYSPTLIASKDLYYTGFVAALVNPVQYKNSSITVTATYDDLHLFSLGGQYMLKSSNFEFYIGSDRLAQSFGFLSAATNKTSASIAQNSSFTGADFYLGFTMKLGPVIEHPMNASSIPTGEKGFLGRLYNRLFKTNK